MNIDTLVESFYTNKDETESLINEVMDLMTSAGITEGSDWCRRQQRNPRHIY